MPLRGNEGKRQAVARRAKTTTLLLFPSGSLLCPKGATDDDRGQNNELQRKPRGQRQQRPRSGATSPLWGHCYLCPLGNSFVPLRLYVRRAVAFALPRMGQLWAFPPSVRPKGESVALPSVFPQRGNKQRTKGATYKLLCPLGNQRGKTGGGK